MKVDHNDSETRQTARGSLLIETNQLTDSNEQNLRKTMLKGLRQILEESRILLEHRFGFRQQHFHRISTQNYRDHKTNFRKKKCTALRRS
jgi:hypothetical protein